MKRIIKTLALSLYFILMTIPAFSAGFPTTFSYQGTLTDTAGNPVSGSRTLVFSLYNVGSAGTAFWAESQALSINSGRFSAVLGSSTPVDLSKFGGDTWLGIAVMGEPEMNPRQKMTSVPYAFNGVPSGVITMWSGSIATIPSGWALCDGSNSTPNLKDRFIVGAGSSYQVGVKGGEATHILTPGELPTHDHGGGNHGHGNYMQLNGYSAEPAGASWGDGFWGRSYPAIPNSGNIINPVGSNLPHENRPPYYALAYIMKL